MKKFAKNLVEQFSNPLFLIIIILCTVNIYILLTILGIPAVKLSSLIEHPAKSVTASNEPISTETNEISVLESKKNAALDHMLNHLPEVEQVKWKTVRMRVTSYCPCRKCCGRFSDGRTANYHKIKPGDRFLAADKKYPFGTEFIVPGYNNNQPVKVLDRGRLIKGNRLDIFVHSHHTAKKYGVKYMDVLVKID